MLDEMAGCLRAGFVLVFAADDDAARYIAFPACLPACPLACRPPSFTPALEADLKELAVVLCLGAKEANDIRSDVAGTLYKRLLREEVTSRRIDAAASPAQVRAGPARAVAVAARLLQAPIGLLLA